MSVTSLFNLALLLLGLLVLAAAPLAWTALLIGANTAALGLTAETIRLWATVALVLTPAPLRLMAAATRGERLFGLLPYLTAVVLGTRPDTLEVAIHTGAWVYVLVLAMISLVPGQTVLHWNDRNNRCSLTTQAMMGLLGGLAVAQAGAAEDPWRYDRIGWFSAFLVAVWVTRSCVDLHPGGGAKPPRGNPGGGARPPRGNPNLHQVWESMVGNVSFLGPPEVPPGLLDWGLREAMTQSPPVVLLDMSGSMTHHGTDGRMHCIEQSISIIRYFLSQGVPIYGFGGGATTLPRDMPRVLVRSGWTGSKDPGVKYVFLDPEDPDLGSLLVREISECCWATSVKHCLETLKTVRNANRVIVVTDGGLNERNAYSDLAGQMQEAGVTALGVVTVGPDETVEEKWLRGLLLAGGSFQISHFRGENCELVKEITDFLGDSLPLEFGWVLPPGENFRGVSILLGTDRLKAITDFQTELKDGFEKYKELLRKFKIKLEDLPSHSPFMAMGRVLAGNKVDRAMIRGMVRAAGNTHARFTLTEGLLQQIEPSALSNPTLSGLFSLSGDIAEGMIGLTSDGANLTDLLGCLGYHGRLTPLKLAAIAFYAKLSDDDDAKRHGNTLLCRILAKDEPVCSELVSEIVGAVRDRTNGSAIIGAGATRLLCYYILELCPEVLTPDTRPTVTAISELWVYKKLSDPDVVKVLTENREVLVPTGTEVMPTPPDGTEYVEVDLLDTLRDFGFSSSLRTNEIQEGLRTIAKEAYRLGVRVITRPGYPVFVKPPDTEELRAYEAGNPHKVHPGGVVELPVKAMMRFLLPAVVAARAGSGRAAAEAAYRAGSVLRAMARHPRGQFMLAAVFSLAGPNGVAPFAQVPDNEAASPTTPIHKEMWLPYDGELPNFPGMKTVDKKVQVTATGPKLVSALRDCGAPPCVFTNPVMFVQGGSNPKALAAVQAHRDFHGAFGILVECVDDMISGAMCIACYAAPGTVTVCGGRRCVGILCPSCRDEIVEGTDPRCPNCRLGHGCVAVEVKAPGPCGAASCGAASCDTAPDDAAPEEEVHPTHVCGCGHGLQKEGDDCDHLECPTPNCRLHMCARCGSTFESEDDCYDHLYHGCEVARGLGGRYGYDSA